MRFYGAMPVLLIIWKDKKSWAGFQKPETIIPGGYTRAQQRGRLDGQGIVKWFSGGKGYGFITQKEGKDIFVHYTAIVGAGYRILKQGERVSFDVGETERGPQAKDVIRF